MTNQSSEEQKDSPKTHAGVAEGEQDPEEREARPGADEPVTHQKHDPEAEKEASERMLRREPEG